MRKLTREAAMFHDYIDMETAANLYKLCNDALFYGMSGSNFLALINLRLEPDFPVVLSKQKRKVCFLLSVIAKKVKDNRRSEWLKQLLKHLQISENYYNAHYRDVAKSTNDDSVKFAKIVNHYFV